MWSASFFLPSCLFSSRGKTRVLKNCEDFNFPTFLINQSSLEDFALKINCLNIRIKPRRLHLYSFRDCVLGYLYNILISREQNTFRSRNSWLFKTKLGRSGEDVCNLLFISTIKMIRFVSALGSKKWHAYSLGHRRFYVCYIVIFNSHFPVDNKNWH